MVVGHQRDVEYNSNFLLKIKKIKYYEYPNANA